MSNFTFGKLSVTVVRVETSADLPSIAAQMARKPPSYEGLVPGWGTPWDDEDGLGNFTGPPPTGAPVVDPEAAEWPSRVIGRLYYWTPDRTARRFVQSDQPGAAQRLRACDFLISTLAEGSLMVAMSSRNRAEQDRTFEPALRSLIQSVDSQAQIQMDTSPIDLNDPDIYMWMLNRLGSNPHLGQGLELLSVREITSRDPLARGANLSQGVDLTRRELQALITNDSIEFGPAKVVLHHEETDATFDFEVFIDGGFTVHTTETHYRESMARSAVGWRAVADLSYRVIPALRDAYRADNELWKDVDRRDFIAQCLVGLRGTAVNTDLIVCDHCGERVHA
ncbi:hypothetical protein FHX49_000021 [Microbacterium endophyticum]|uniref:Uncharacterized protein n=1 Tax=Microbacterium endophyticum TaxID=1526412 RepID=A0A7W4V1C3_9MICO|nr:hypothetical protein [Microbacterium endophyticum]MBB2974480.1 hypothetical protein [Microbacterium endophyticum]NIK36777.1 hypothetical protein [Microbacterium endophyticum]